MIIVLEGIDNAGKTSIAEKLMDYYEKKGKIAILSKELTTKVGGTIKECLKDNELSPISKAFLFAADRQIRIEKLKEKIDKDNVIIFDRYLYSAIAYREAENLSGNWVRELNKFIPKSDVCIYIDISPEESINRNTDKKFNIHYSLDKLKKIREAYLKYVNMGELILVDGMRDLDEVIDDIINILEEKEE